MTRDEIYSLHFFGVSLELKLFFGALLLGFVLGALFDVFRALRMSLRHCAAAVFAEDLLFMLVSGLAYYSYSTALCRGQLRLFVLAAMAIGFVLYLTTIGRLLCRLLAKMAMIAKTPFDLLAKMLKKAAGLLCGVPFFQKSPKKFRENPCTEADPRL